MGTNSLLQLIQRKVGARPDGVFGPLTAAAIAGALGITVEPETPVLRATGQWPRDKQDEMVSFYGPPDTGHTQIVPPYQLYYAGKPVPKITVHSRIAPAVMRVLQKTLDHYGQEAISAMKLNVYDGCYNNRPKRGGASLSVHAYAAAIDFCAEQNALHMDHTQALFAHADYDHWWNLWEQEGAVSLGRTRDFDWMHVQFARL